jgi:hypothetical protein
MISEVAFQLPGGVCTDEGSLIRRALLAPLTGTDEEWLAGRPPTLPVAAVVSGLLDRVAVVATEEGLRLPAGELLVADRDYLLLGLREITYGSHLDAVLTCPACAERMDVALETGDIPIGARPQLAPRYRLVCTRADGGRAEVEFHLPTGSDQEAVIGAEDRESALLRRCLDSIDGQAVGDDWLDRVDAAAAAQLDDRMVELAPDVELAMDLRCPDCGHEFAQDFDLAAFLLQEMLRGARQVVEEVHALAFHYHWAEQEILALPRSRRRRYLDLIDDQLRRGASE